MWTIMLKTYTYETVLNTQVYRRTGTLQYSNYCSILKCQKGKSVATKDTEILKLSSKRVIQYYHCLRIGTEKKYGRGCKL